MSMIEHRSVDLRTGRVSISAHDTKDTEIILSQTADAISINLHFSREEAGAVLKTLEEVIAAYDATAAKKEEGAQCPDPQLDPECHDDFLDGCMIDGIDDYGSVQ